MHLVMSSDFLTVYLALRFDASIVLSKNCVSTVGESYYWAFHGSYANLEKMSGDQFASVALISLNCFQIGLHFAHDFLWKRGS